jgi:uncharacterized membrane protein YjdF
MEGVGIHLNMKQAGEHVQRVERADERVVGRRERLVAWTASLAFVLISLVSSAGVAKYRFSFLFLIPILWTVYGLRRRLSIRPLHFALFALALLIHDLGAFGAYSWSVIGLQFDWCVHFLFGLVGALIVARALEAQLGARGFGLGLLVVLVVTGIGGLHEIVEAASTRYLGKDLGMLYIGADNTYDTQEDLLANVLGACAALARRRLRALTRAIHH